MVFFCTSLVLVTAALAEPSQLRVGNAGWGLLFDGVDDIVLLDNMPAPPFTIEFWAQPLDLKDGGGRALASYNVNAAMISRVTPTGLILSILELGAEIHTSTATVDSFGVPPAPGEIFHWAMSLSKDGDYAVYINGDGVATGSLSEDDMRAIVDEYMAFPWTLGGRFGRYLGQYVTDDRAFGGVLDEIRIWSCVRSREEILDSRFLHNLEGPAAANLTLHLGFDMPDESPPSTLLGAGVIFKTPTWVPSPIPGVGSAVVVDVLGSGVQNIEICASMNESVDGVVATATFPQSLSTGVLMIQGPLQAEVSIPLSENRSTHFFQLCGHVSYLPQRPGFDVTEFHVRADIGNITLEATGTLHVRVRRNHHPVAGAARAMLADGQSGYALAGHTPQKDEFSLSLWMKADTTSSEPCMVGRHWVQDAENYILLFFHGGAYSFLWKCGAGPPGFINFPREPDDTFVLETGMTGKQIRDSRLEPHHMTVTAKCVPSGQDHRIRFAAYRNGKLMAQSTDIGECMPGCYVQDLTPWELGAEYDPSPSSEQMVPSNFFRGVLDDFRVYGSELAAWEVEAVASGANVREEELLLHYTFDSDDAETCKYRRLVNSSSLCFGLNERMFRVDSEALDQFPGMNSLLGRENAATHIPSPFPIKASLLHHSMRERECAEIGLEATDVDGDALVFSLGYISGSAEVSLESGVLTFCDIMGGRHDVDVFYDACDPLGLCASGGAGLGHLLVHVFPSGPIISSFQYLPEAQQLRMVLNMPTNMPDVSDKAALHRLLSLEEVPGTVIQGVWEEGGQGLRLLLGAALDELNFSVSLQWGGQLRDAAQTTYFSYSSSPALVEKQCSLGSYLPPGGESCEGCGLGRFLILEGDSAGVCRSCSSGSFSNETSATSCTICPRGTFQSQRGQSSCESCEQRAAGSTTRELASTSIDDCICPEETFPLLGGQLVCEPCSTGLQQAAGYYAREVHFSPNGSALLVTPRMVACADRRCAEGQELGSCGAGQDLLACDACVRGWYWNDSRGRCDPCGVVQAVPLLVALCLAGCALFLSSCRTTTVFNSDIATITATVAIFFSTTQALGAIADLVVAHEDVLRYMLRALCFLSFSPDLLGTECVLQQNDAVLSYLACLLALPLAVLAVTVIGRMRLAMGKTSWASVFSSQGSVVMILYLASARVAVLPLQCAANPDGSSSVQAYRSVICLEVPEHIAMVILAVVGLLLFSITPLAAVSWAVWVYPNRIQRPGSIQFLERWRFAFDRFTNESYTYAVVYLWRNLLIALTPAVFTNSQSAQILLLAVILVSGLAIQVRVMPWRTSLANFIDALASASVSMLLVGSSLLMVLTTPDIGLLQTWVSLHLLATFGIFAGVVLNYFRQWFRSKKYQVFISHHKGSAAALARWFKTCMLAQQRLQLKIFLDSDDLLSVDVLFDTVAHQTQSVILILTKEYFGRPFCMGEFVSAIQSGVPIVAVKCKDCETLNTELIVEHVRSMWKESHKALLSSMGITEDLVAKAIAHLQHNIIPVVDLDRSQSETEQVKVVSATMEACRLGTFTFTKVSVMKSISITSLQPQILLMSSWQHEARTCCFLVRRKLVLLMRTVVEILHEDQLNLLATKSAFPDLGVLVVLLMQGTLEDPFVANSLFLARKAYEDVHLVPLIADSNFSFPDTAFWSQLASGRLISASLLVPSQTLRDVQDSYEHLLTVIALRLSIQASEKLQATELQEASRKLQLLLKDRKNMLKDARTQGDESESPEPPKISPKPPKIAL
eukprot:s2047_g1.t1